MPGQAEYRSLHGASDGVYRPTTLSALEPRNPAEGDIPGVGLLGSVKRVLNRVSASRDRCDVNAALVTTGAQPRVIPRAQPPTQDRNSTMPTSACPEETALLGTMPSDSMDDIELKSIQLQSPASRALSVSAIAAGVVEERVETGRGSILVAVQGQRGKPAILTYHDLGLNYISSFQAFFNFCEMRSLLDHFCVYHVNAPGQEEGAAPLPDDYQYPTMDELADQIGFVLAHFGLRSVIGLGVGAGANILSRFAMMRPQHVEVLCLVNCTSTQAGWIEWGYQKLNARHLRSKGVTQAVVDYLMWHHFGRGTEERNHDLAQVYRSYLERRVHPANLAMFIDSYVRRTDLGISRDPGSNTLIVPVLNMTGAISPHCEDTVTLNGRLDPAKCTWMKLQDCGMVLEEQPAKVAEAFRLFLQGQGYAMIRKRKVPVAAHAAPADAPMQVTGTPQGGSAPTTPVVPINNSASTPQWQTSAINITENPISEAVLC